MLNSNLIDRKNNYKLNSYKICKNLYKGACVKIKNSEKIFQVVGINQKIKVCWIREWPCALEVKKTFSLQINQITIQTFCTSSFIEK